MHRAEAGIRGEGGLEQRRALGSENESESRVGEWRVGQNRAQGLRKGIGSEHGKEVKEGDRG